jgi:hypothetical protein
MMTKFENSVAKDVVAQRSKTVGSGLSLPTRLNLSKCSTELFNTTLRRLKSRYAPSVDRLTESREITPYVWAHPDAEGWEYQQPREMPLIMRSSDAFSWLIGSFGSIRFFSEGT